MSIDISNLLHRLTDWFRETGEELKSRFQENSPKFSPKIGKDFYLPPGVVIDGSQFNSPTRLPSCCLQIRPSARRPIPSS